LTPFARFDYYLSFSAYLSSAAGVRDNECDVPAKSPAAQAHARLSCADGNEEWTPGAETAPRKGT
jgi:hypothetical protein